MCSGPLSLCSGPLSWCSAQLLAANISRQSLKILARNCFKISKCRAPLILLASSMGLKYLWWTIPHWSEKRMSMFLMCGLHQRSVFMFSSSSFVYGSLSCLTIIFEKPWFISCYHFVPEILMVCALPYPVVTHVELALFLLTHQWFRHHTIGMAIYRCHIDISVFLNIEHDTIFYFTWTRYDILFYMSIYFRYFTLHFRSFFIYHFPI